MLETSGTPIPPAGNRRGSSVPPCRLALRAVLSWAHEFTFSWRCTALMCSEQTAHESLTLKSHYTAWGGDGVTGAELWTLQDPGQEYTNWKDNPRSKQEFGFHDHQTSGSDFYWLTVNNQMIWLIWFSSPEFDICFCVSDPHKTISVNKLFCRQKINVWRFQTNFPFMDRSQSSRITLALILAKPKLCHVYREHASRSCGGSRKFETFMSAHSRKKN